MIVSGSYFIYERMALHGRLDELYDGMFDSVEADGDGVYVNLPAWLTFHDSRFPIGSEGITYMTEYFGTADMVEVNTGEQALILGFLVPELRPDLDIYWWDVAAPQETNAIVSEQIQAKGAGYVFTVAGNRWLWDSARRFDDAPEDSDYIFENGVELARASAEYIGDGVVAVDLTWRVTGSDVSSAQPFVHLACPDTPVVSQLDGMPLRGLLDFSIWAEGDVWQETRHLDGAPANDTDCFIRVGLFNPVEQSRVAIVDSSEDEIHIEIYYVR